MSYFGYNDWDNVLQEIEEFLKTHSIADLLRIVQAAVERKEEYDD